MSWRNRTAFSVEVLVALGAAVGAILAVILPQWIETVFRLDPDGGDGSAEWLIPVLLAVVAVLMSVVARIQWRRSRRALPAS